MSVLAANRKESKWEPITYSTELHDMLIELMQRNFGVKDLDKFVRMQYAHGKEPTENYAKYNYLMQNFKERIDQQASLLTSNVRAANSIYPRNVKEFERRRDFQNAALINCEILIKELQRVIEIFYVDINIYKRYSNAIDREIDLIKRWRQRDNRLKSYVEIKG